MERIKITSFKTYIKELKEYPNCKNWRIDTDTCKSGCKKINLPIGNICPYIPESERKDDKKKKYQSDCPCYKQ